MQRRQFLKSTSVALAATLSGCGGSDSGVAAQSNAPASPAPAPAPPPAPAPGPAAAPPPPPGGRFLDVPSQLNEQQMYDNVLGWTWSASDKVTQFAANPGPVSHGSITNDGEGDDLWNHYQAYKRTGNPIHLQWAQRWRDYFVNQYYNAWAGGDGVEHTYGQGLIVWGMERGDSAALATATQIVTRIESISASYVPGQQPMSYWGGRLLGRHTIVVCYYAYYNPIARWITLRDKHINCWLQSPDYQNASNSNIAGGGGMYFPHREAYAGTGYLEPFRWDQGWRVGSGFSMALIVEALWRAYLLTARTDLRDRIIECARFFNHYAHNPAHVNAMSGGHWGHSNGGYLHNTGGASHTNPNTAPADCSYETSYVNSLVWGYKLSGDASLLARAKMHFRKGTQYNDPVVGAPKEPDNQVHHYVDTRTDPDPIYFNYNKGELQYCYQLFENGGVPSVIGTGPPPPG